jgi:aminopeptidase N
MTSDLGAIYLGTTLSTANNISYDKKSERVTLTFPEEISAKEVVLAIDFKGVMNNVMAGFSRSKYRSTFDVHPATPKEGDFYYMLSTQFESCDARRAFPCFDEPNLKASFDFEIEVPKGLVALSNMPVKSEREGSKPNLQFVLFDKTPVMSTYVGQPSFSKSLGLRD